MNVEALKKTIETKEAYYFSRSRNQIWHKGKTSGYTQVEIDGISNIHNKGFVDAYRILYPEKVEYSFWSVRFGARARNVGWRIDYFFG